MSDIIKKLKHSCAIITASVLFLSGCSGNGIYSSRILVEEQETDYSSVYAEIIEFTSLPDKEFRSEINETVSNDVRSAIGEFDKLSADAVQTLPPGVKTTLNISQRIKRQSGGIISFITENYTYLGGAHGTTAWLPYTFDALSDEPKLLELKDLFSDDGYIETINRMIDELVAEKPEEYSELWAEPHITDEDQRQFYMTDDDLVIFFPPYELSYYARGFVEFPLRLTELNGKLKEEFRPDSR